MKSADKVSVIVGAIGGLIGFVLEITISWAVDWGFDLARSAGMLLLSAVAFFVSARASQRQAERDGDQQRVEQVSKFTKSETDCYESIVIRQETY